MANDSTQTLLAEILDFIAAAERALDASEGADQLADHFDAIFRPFHGLTSLAVMMDRPALRDHMRRMERSLATCRPNPRLSAVELTNLRRGLTEARALAGGVVPAAEAPPVVTPSGRVRVLAFGHAERFGARVARLLDRAGFETIASDDPEAAPELIHAHAPVAVLYDHTHLAAQGFREKIRYAAPGAVLVAVHGAALRAENEGDDLSNLADTCRSAARLDVVTRLLNEACDLLKFQFSDLSDFLHQTGRDDLRDYLAEQIQDVLRRRHAYRTASAALT